MLFVCWKKSLGILMDGQQQDGSGRIYIIFNIISLDGFSYVLRLKLKYIQYWVGVLTRLGGQISSQV